MAGYRLLHSHHGGHEWSRQETTGPSLDRLMASIFWYVIAGIGSAVVLSRAMGAALSYIGSHRTPKRQPLSSSRNPQPTSRLRRLSVLLARLSHSQLLLPSPLTWLSPPRLSHTLAILLYAVLTTLLLTLSLPSASPLATERFTLRAGTISLAQTPLLFLLVTRDNPLPRLLGTSHERINWAHRWAGRCVLALATVHGGYFLSEWLAAMPNGEFVWLELRTMPHVKLGVGAWGVLVWMGVSALAPLRRGAYEVFVAQHVVSAGAFLALLYGHLPVQYRFVVRVAAGVWAATVGIRTLALVWRNVRVSSGLCSGRKALAGPRIGYAATVTAPSDDITILTVHGARFSWQPGQHFMVWTPALWAHSMHPFTLTNCSLQGEDGQGGIGADMKMVMRTKTGFTWRLNALVRAASQDTSTSSGELSLRVFLAGPYGCSSRMDRFGTVGLISASTGASFTMPILESLLSRDDGKAGAGFRSDDNGEANPAAVRHVRMLLLAKKRAHVEPYLRRIRQLMGTDLAVDARVHVEVDVAITGPDTEAAIASDGADLEMDDWNSGPDSLSLSARLIADGDDGNPQRSEPENFAINKKDLDAAETDSAIEMVFPRSHNPSLPCGTADDPGSDADSGFDDDKPEREEDENTAIHLLDGDAIAISATGLKAGLFTIRETTGRSDLQAYMRQMIEEASSLGRDMGLAVCGGKLFTVAARRALGSALKDVEGRERQRRYTPEVFFHAEEFGS